MRMKRQPYKVSKPAVRIELKPCPFCGGDASQPDCARAGGSTPRWEIGCATNFCVTIVNRSRGAVVTLWNTRDGYRPNGDPTPGKRGELEANEQRA